MKRPHPYTAISQAETVAQTKAAPAGLPFWMRRLLAPYLRRRNPTLSNCARCGLPWVREGQDCYDFWPIPRFDVESHGTWLTSGNGFFCLCRDCWKELKFPSRRMPHYHKAFWLTVPLAKWEKIKASVTYEELTKWDNR